MDTKEREEEIEAVCSCQEEKCHCGCHCNGENCHCNAHRAARLLVDEQDVDQFIASLNDWD